MSRQRTHYNRRTYFFPDDFPQRLVWFQQQSGLPWSEIARRLGITPITIRRWGKPGSDPTIGISWRWWTWLKTWAFATCLPSREAIAPVKRRLTGWAHLTALDTAIEAFSAYESERDTSEVDSESW